MTSLTARRSLLSLVLLGSLLAPPSLYAQKSAAPSVVTGLSARQEKDGSIVVTWSPGKETDIAFYRVYFSHKSILENDGYYDDYENTNDAKTTYTAKNPPTSSSPLFIAVMAVNSAGEEGPYFVEEAELTLAAVSSAPASSVSSSVSSSAPASISSSSLSSSLALSSSSIASSAAKTSISSAAASAGGSGSGATLRLLSAKALTPGTILLELSAPLETNPDEAIEGITVNDSAGVPLSIEGLTESGSTVILETQKQVARMVYEIRFASILEGEGGVPLDPIDRMAFFSGHAQGVAQNSKPPLPPLPENGVPDVMKFTLNSVPQKGKLFTVVGQWEYDPRTPSQAYVVIRQSRDGGETFGDPEILSQDVDGVSIPNVSPESFTLIVNMVDEKGQASPGIVRSIFTSNVIPSSLPGSRSSVSSKVQVVPPSPPQGGSLASSGAETLIMVLLTTGGITGLIRKRRGK